MGRITFLVFIIWIQITLVFAQENPNLEPNTFEFAFLTDIHIRPDMNAPKYFQMCIDMVNELNPDFVLTGGDLIFDAMRGNYNHCDSLFTLFTEMSKGFNMPLYPCIGNHDLFAIYKESPENENHPDYKYGMYERYFGDTYYSFNHKGWHFIVLNSLIVNDYKYKGYFHEEQLEWLKNDLKKLHESTPIVLVSHIPLITTWQFVNGGSGAVKNAVEVFKLLENKNLKLILQGHIHWYEYGFINNRFHFITGGSIAGNGWKGRRHNTKEGFVYIRVKGEEISFDYMDHGGERERLKLKPSEMTQ
jgi:Icc protein